jgi:chromosome segregation ATPase
LQNQDSKLKEQLQKMVKEVDNLKDERENLRSLMNDSINKCSSLIKEKGELEKEINKRNLQIENLKNTNLILHKNIAESDRKEANMSEGVIKIGENKLEENNMINLIRKEKEKNKVFLDEIKKLKNNLK